ncbi:NlpC/P60 family protein [Streptomyces zhihengii]
MGSHRRPKPARSRGAGMLTTTAAAAVVLSAQPASADPLPDPGKKGVEAEVARLYEAATQATEKFNGAKEKADALQKEVAELQDAAARKQADLNVLREQVGSFAAAQYRAGGLDPSVQLMLSGDPDSFLDRAGVQQRVGERRMTALRLYQAEQRQLGQQRAEASRKLADLEASRAEQRRKKSEVQGKLAEAQKLLNTLSAEERARIAAEDERANRAGARADLGDERSASARGAQAFAAAKSRVGMPYVWGATGPGSFDCSGLTSWAFKQAGVSIPRTSQAQAGVGTRIGSLGDLRPGDLIIMRTDLSHVGFYAGNGQILHSPKPGAQVRYESIARSGMPFMWGVRL